MVTTPTLTGGGSITLGTIKKEKISISRFLFNKNTAFGSTSSTVATPLLGATRTIFLQGVVTATSAVDDSNLDDWVTSTDENWAKTANPVVKKYKSMSNKEYNVTVDSLEYDRYFNKIEYSLTLIETVFSATS